MAAGHLRPGMERPALASRPCFPGALQGGARQRGGGEPSPFPDRCGLHPSQTCAGGAGGRAAGHSKLVSWKWSTTNTIAYQGGLHTDGDGVYDTVAARHGLRHADCHAGCLAHTRSKFTDLGKAAPEVTVPILLYIHRIYHIERQTRQTAAPPACRALIRRARSLPIVEELHRFVLAERQRHLPGSDVARAINYTLNQWKKILVCFGDGALELDTNLVGNMIRTTKLGMKNCARSSHHAECLRKGLGFAMLTGHWMFFGSLEAGTNNALIYTLLANCRAQGLDPEEYLVEVLKRLPHNATAVQAAGLTPTRIAAERKSKAETNAEANDEAEQVA